MAANNSYPVNNVSSAFGEAMAVIDDTDEHLSGELSKMFIQGGLPADGSGRPYIKLEDRSECLYDGQQAYCGPSLTQLPSSELDTDAASLHNPSFLFQQSSQFEPRSFINQGFGHSSTHQDQEGFSGQGPQYFVDPYEADKKRRFEGEVAAGLDSQSHNQWRQQMSVNELDDSLDDVHQGTLVFSVEVDEHGDNVLHIASMLTDVMTMIPLFNFLDENKVTAQCINMVNKQKQTPLFCAVQARNLHLIIWLLSKRADPNIQGTLYVDRDEYVWRSPLHLAAMMGDPSINILRILLKAPTIDLNQLSHADKQTPLHMALKAHKQNFPCRQILMELLNRGADFSIKEQSSSKTPFILAIETQDLELLQEIMLHYPADKRRALLQERTRSGDTCLHAAAGLSKMNPSDKERLLRLLITNGANGSVQNNAKELPRDYARKEWDNIRNF